MIKLKNLIKEDPDDFNYKNHFYDWSTEGISTMMVYFDIKDKVLSVQPGMTDLASIEFSNENEMLENLDNVEKEYTENILPIKLKYYLDYVDRHSLVEDLKIIAMTIFKIIRH